MGVNTPELRLGKADALVLLPRLSATWASPRSPAVQCVDAFLRASLEISLLSPGKYLVSYIDVKRKHVSGF